VTLVALHAQNVDIVQTIDEVLCHSDDPALELACLLAKHVESTPAALIPCTALPDEVLGPDAEQRGEMPEAHDIELAPALDRVGDLVLVEDIPVHLGRTVTKGHVDDRLHQPDTGAGDRNLQTVPVGTTELFYLAAKGDPAVSQQRGALVGDAEAARDRGLKEQRLCRLIGLIAVEVQERPDIIGDGQGHPLIVHPDVAVHARVADPVRATCIAGLDLVIAAVLGQGSVQL
jgi:hypothetical protein